MDGILILATWQYRQRMKYMTTNIWIFPNYDYHAIQRISQHYATKTVEMETILEAVQSINKGKAEDIFGISIEHFLFAGNMFLVFLHQLIKVIFGRRLIPDIIKIGLLSPVFKNKGEKSCSNNCSRITVLPILLNEYILRIDLRSGSLQM